MRAILLIVLVLIAMCGWLSAKVVGQPHSPPVDSQAYYGCMDREVEAAVKDAVANGMEFYKIDTRQIGDQAFRKCAALFANGAPLQSFDRRSAELRANDALTALMRAEKRQNAQYEREKRQAELDAPKLEAESAAATRSYGNCLFREARALALSSSELAEVITKAVFAACMQERKLISNVYSKYHDNGLNNMALDEVDKEISGKLILEIIKARAAKIPRG